MANGEIVANLANWLIKPLKPASLLGFRLLAIWLMSAKGWLKVGGVSRMLATVSRGWLIHSPRHCWVSGVFSQLASLAALSLAGGV